jgi:hypothetical protein
LTAAGIPHKKLTAETVSFEGFGYGSTVFVTVHGATYNGNGDELKAACFADVPKPSEGGYVLNFLACNWFQKPANQ